MPVWKISHPPNVFTDPSEKQALAKEITAWYSTFLPAYYVNVQFRALQPENYYVAGSPTSNTVFIDILHIARHWDPTQPERAIFIKDSFDKILKPYTMEKGLHLEYAIQESAAKLWRICGIDPPESFEPHEKEQAGINRKKLDELKTRST